MSRHVVDVVIAAGTANEWRGQVQIDTGSVLVEALDDWSLSADMEGQPITGPGIPAGTLVGFVNGPRFLAMSKAFTLIDSAELLRRLR
jgi:hypothetical protein